MGMVVYFPAVAPPDANAGLIDDMRGISVTTVVVTVVVVARKKFLRVDDDGSDGLT
jgi:hypothetical protein